MAKKGTVEWYKEQLRDRNHQIAIITKDRKSQAILNAKLTQDNLEQRQLVRSAFLIGDVKEAKVLDELTATKANAFFVTTLALAEAAENTRPAA